MHSKTISTFTVFLLFLGFLDHSLGQLLTAEYLPIKLPTADDLMVPYYDGEDSIYLFGSHVVPYNKIMVYSISDGTLEKVGTMPGVGMGGSIQSDTYGNIFYFGGANRTGIINYSRVFKFDMVTNKSIVVDVFPNPVVEGTSIKYNGTVYVFGGYGQQSSGEIFSFNMVTLTHSRVATTPFATYPTTSVRVGNKAYVFGKRTGLRTALELDLDTLQMRAVGASILPLFTQYWVTSVWDGTTFAYIIGGYKSTDGAPTGGIIQYDPATFSSTFLPVRNLQVEGLSYFYIPPSSVFVPSLNRIYCFGGMSDQYNDSTGGHNRKQHDEIFFIDLKPISPPTTTLTPLPTTTESPISTTLNPDFISCMNRSNGLYPHPTDCAQFIGCQNGEPTFFSCPLPFLYDPVLTLCTFPDEVECVTSCVGKVDGNYPHPHDCSLYMLCRSGVTTILKCPHPLLFHPARLGCAYHDEVECYIFDF